MNYTRWGGLIFSTWLIFMPLLLLYNCKCRSAFSHGRPTQQLLIYCFQILTLNRQALHRSDATMCTARQLIAMPKAAILLIARKPWVRPRTWRHMLASPRLRCDTPRLCDLRTPRHRTNRKRKWCHRGWRRASAGTRRNVSRCDCNKKINNHYHA